MRKLISALSSNPSKQLIAVNVIYWSSPFWLVWFQMAVVYVISLLLGFAENAPMLLSEIEKDSGVVLGFITILYGAFIAIAVRAVSYIYLAVTYVVRSRMWQMVSLVIYIILWLALLIVFSWNKELGFRIGVFSAVLSFMTVYHLPFLLLSRYSLNYRDQIQEQLEAQKAEK